MPKEFQYKQPKTTDSYRKGWEKAFGSYCPINIDNPEICSAGTCNLCIEFKENRISWDKAFGKDWQSKTCNELHPMPDSKLEVTEVRSLSGVKIIETTEQKQHNG